MSKPVSKKVRARKAAAVLTVIVVICVITGRVQPVDRLLLAGAAHIDGVPTAADRYILNDHSVLLHGAADPYGVYDGWRIQDLKSGAVDRCTALNRWYDQLPGNAEAVTRLSPSGHAVLFWLSASSRLATATASLDGSRATVVDTDRASEPAPLWTADSERWIEFSRTEFSENIPVRVHRFGDRSAGHRGILDLPVSRSYGSLRMCVISESFLAGVACERGAMAARSFRAALRDTGIPPREFTITLPDGWRYDRALFSPAGDRVVWTLFTSARCSVGLTLRRALQRIRFGIAPVMSIWSSRLDGSDMREIGCVDQAFLSALDGPPFEDLRCLPSGDRIAFLRRQALYTVPVD